MSLTSKDSTRIRILVWLALTGAGLLLAWASGRLQPHYVPDSPSYLEYPLDSLDAACRSYRTPGYPIWLRMIIGIGGVGLVPVFQVTAHATAVFVLITELRRWSMPWIQLVAVAIAVGLGCTPTDHINTISTDALAASLGVATAAMALRWSRLRATVSSIIAVVAVAFVTIMVRPAYLFLIPWLFVAGWLLGQLRSIDSGTEDRQSIVRSSLALAIFTLIPILGWMTLRYAVVRDFGMLPFGHQNLAGILVQLATDDELNQIQGDASDLAREVVKEKSRLAATGHTFPDGEPGATMTIDARWDEMTYFVVIPAAERIVRDDRIAQHNKIAELNRTIIKTWPQRYAFWLIKSARRGAWAIAADIVMHPVFITGILLSIVLVLFRAGTGWQAAHIATPQPATSALAIIALTYMIMKVGFVILTSPAIGRFSDAAAIFLPAWLAVLAVTWTQAKPSD